MISVSLCLLPLHVSSSSLMIFSSLVLGKSLQLIALHVQGVFADKIEELKDQEDHTEHNFWVVNLAESTEDRPTYQKYSAKVCFLLLVQTPALCCKVLTFPIPLKMQALHLRMEIGVGLKQGEPFY